MMSDKPLVSVIIIFFNSEFFLKEAIESVFSQLYEHWELFLVDDGSTDASTETALTYARTHPDKVHYLEHEGHQNCGMSATRNLGIRHAKGKYIALLDSDDIWFPDKLKQQVAIMEAQPSASMVYGPSQKWYSWTGNPEDAERDSYYHLGIDGNTLVQPPKLITLCLQGKAITPCPSNILFRSKIIKKIGGFEEDWRGMYQLYEDQVFLSKVFLHEPVYISDYSWDKYRKHQSSCVAQAKQLGQEEIVRLAYLNWLESYLKTQNLQEPNIVRLIRKEKILCGSQLGNKLPNVVKRLIRSL